MPRLTDKIREEILAQFHIGKSQYELAKVFKVSTATIHALVKGQKPKLKEKLKDRVAAETLINTIDREIQLKENETQVKAFNKEVDILVRRKELVFSIAERAAHKLHSILDGNVVYEKVNIGDGVQQFEPRNMNPADVRDIVEANDKLSITLGVNQRHSNVQIANINQQSQAKTISPEVRSMVKRFAEQTGEEIFISE